MAAGGKPSPSLWVVLREWGRIGILGFGGPPVHIAMMRERFVESRGWIPPDQFEDAIAATGLLPGPASTQLSIYCGWRLRGAMGAIVGGLAFIVPGLIAIIALAALFLSSAPPEVVLAAGAGAGAAVAAVALSAGAGLVGPSWVRAEGRHRRWVLYLLLGGVAAAAAGPWVVLVLLAAGFTEVVWRGGSGAAGTTAAFALPTAVLVLAAATGGTAALVWVAFKVGALSYGGGFVIIPLMQADAVDNYGWMTDADFLNAVALGQLTPGPVVQTVAVVGYAAAGVGGALLAATVAFAPSFAFILGGSRHFNTLRANPRVRAFLDGAGPAAIGAILGVSIPLAAALSEAWQFALLAAAVLLLFPLRRGVVPTLLVSAAAGAVLVAVGAPLP
ncbi:MAG TPA: chromate efflux transporter [Solirubrobacterales bacterium]|nr:chromate efflux transporter [Solirubrobacterales bacterium]